MTTTRRERLAAIPTRAREDFYEGALFPDERRIYREAHEQRDLHGEVALLRLRLYRLLRERAAEGDGPARTTQIVRIIDLLVKALRAQGARADREQDDSMRTLDEAMPRVLDTVRDGKVAE